MFKDLLLVLLPSVFLLVVLFYLFKNYLDKQFEFAKVRSQQEIYFPLKIQAFERLTLFLERIKPENLLLRVGHDNSSAQEYQYTILTEIRNEFNHNIAQQIYITPDTWVHIENAVNYLMSSLNDEMRSFDTNNSGKELAKYLLQNDKSQVRQAINMALEKLKIEFQNNL